MCQVQRVINSCGHRNDHVLLTCHTEKRRSFLLENNVDPIVPGEDPDQLIAPVPAVELSHSTSPHNDSNDSAAASNSDGFDARTEPYCANAIIHVLDSPKGFECMVPRCFTAD